MAEGKVSRSSFDALPWKCSCKCINKPTKHRFINLPALKCKNCKKELTLDFGFSLGDIEAEEKSLIGEVENQGPTRLCVPYAYAKAAEITERVYCVKNGMDPDEVNPVNPHELNERFSDKFPKEPSAASLARDAGSVTRDGGSRKWSADSLIRDAGLHRVLHMGLILRSEGIQRKDSEDRYVAADVSTIPKDDFVEVCRSLAEGSPLVATYLTGKRKFQLPFCKIYKSARPWQYEDKDAAKIGHAVVLIGAGIKKGKKYFYFMNSWGMLFCVRMNKRGDVITAGIGKLKMEDLTKNLVRLSGPNETGGWRRLEDQEEFEISKVNYILMTATKNRCNEEKVRNIRDDLDGVTGEDDFDGGIGAELSDDWTFADDEGGQLQSNYVVSQGHGGRGSCYPWLRLPWKKLLPHYSRQSWVTMPPTHAHDSSSHDPANGPRRERGLLHQGTSLFKKWRGRFTRSKVVPKGHAIRT